MRLTITTKSNLRDLIEARPDGEDIIKVLNARRIRGQGGENYGLSFSVFGSGVYFENILPGISGYDMTTESNSYLDGEVLPGISINDLDLAYFQAVDTTCDIVCDFN